MTEETIEVENDGDLNNLRKRLRRVAAQCDFSDYEITKLVTASSEISRNILDYAGSGTVSIEARAEDRPEVRVTFVDEGPGIADETLAMEDGFSGDESNGLGVGLPGARRLTDDFELNSEPGQGTRISFVVRKDKIR